VTEKLHIRIPSTEKNEFTPTPANDVENYEQRLQNQVHHSKLVLQTKNVNLRQWLKFEYNLPLQVILR